MSKKLNNNCIDLVIYHANCPDGFGSALAVHQYYRKYFPNSKVIFHPASYGSRPPNVIGKNVLICDFSYKKDVIAKMITECASFLIIDHHTSAEKELADVDDAYKIFDMAHSGAYLTWRYFFPDEVVPLLIEYIQDHDIWTKEMPYTEEVTAYIASLPFEIDEYAKLLDEAFIDKVVIPMGTVLLRQQNATVEKALANSWVRFVGIGGGFYFVAMCNSTVLPSEIGNRLLKKYPNCNFSVVYSTGNGRTYVSLRSADDRTDVSEIAGKFGGGGHRNASGCGMADIEMFGRQIGGDGTLFEGLGRVEFVFGERFNYVVANETLFGHQLGRYLMQGRLAGSHIIRECCALYRKSCHDEAAFKRFDFSVIWNYAGGQTWYIVTWAEMNSDTVLALFGGYNDYELVGTGQCRFSVPGLRIIAF